MSGDVSIRFGAQVGDLLTALDKVSEEVGRSEQFFNRHRNAINAFDERLTKLIGTLDPTAGAMKKLETASEQLDQALKLGLITVQQHQDLTARAAVAWGTGARGVEALGKSSNLALWEIQALTHAVRASGDQMMAGADPMRALTLQGFQLVGVLGPTRLAMLGLGAAALAIPATLAALVVKAEQADQTMARLRASFLAAGDASRFSREDIEKTVRQMALMPGVSKTAAEEIVANFARTRQIGGQLFQQLTQIVADFAVASGKDATEASKDLAKAFADPLQGAKSLDQQFGILSATQLRAIERFMRLGDIVSAQRALYDALNDRIRNLATTSMTDLQSSASNVERAWDRLWGKLGDFGIISALKGRIADLFNFSAGLLGDDDARMAFLEKKIETLTKLRDLAATQFAKDNLSSEIAALDKEYAALFAKRQAALSKPVEGKGADSDGSPVGSRAAGTDRSADQDRLKRVLADTQNLAGVEERRRAVQEKITALQEAAKIATGKELEDIKARIAVAQQELANIKPKESEGKVEGYRRELAEIQQADRRSLDLRKADDLEFWRGKLANLQKGSKDYASVFAEVRRLEKDIAAENYREQIAGLERQREAAKKGSDDRIRIADDELRLARERYGQDSQEYQQALKRKEEMERERAREQDQIRLQQLEAQRESARADLALAEENLSYRRQIGEITAQQELAALRDLRQRELEDERQAVEEKLKLASLEAREKERIMRELVQLQHRARLQDRRDQHAANIESRRDYSEVATGIGQAFSQGYRSILLGGNTLRRGLGVVLNGIGNAFFNLLEKMVGRWLTEHGVMAAISRAFGLEEVATTTATEATKTTATVAGEGTRLATKEAAAGQGLLMQAGVALKEVAINAWTAASGAYAAIASIPYVGPFLAPIAAAAALAAVFAFGKNIASSAGGEMEVPEDGALYQLHAKETVLPASYATRLAGLLDNVDLVQRALKAGPSVPTGIGFSPALAGLSAGLNARSGGWAIPDLSPSARPSFGDSSSEIHVAHTNNVTVHVHGGDPKQVEKAVRRAIRANPNDIASAGKVAYRNFAKDARER